MKKTLLLILSVTFIVTCNAKSNKAIVASTIRLPEQEILYNEGIEHLGNAEYDDAVKKFTAAIAIDNKFSKAYYNRAVAYFDQDKLTKALNDVDEALALVPENESSNFHLLKGKILYASGNIPAASSEIDYAISIDPTNTNAQIDKAALYQVTEQYDKAIELYNKVNYLNGGSAMIYNELGNCYNKRKDTITALEFYRKAHKADPADNVAKFNLAVSVWNVQKDSVTALSLLDSLIANDITNSQYYISKGFIYCQTAQWDKAMENFDIALLQKQDKAKAYLGRGVVYLSRNEYEDALTAFNMAISENTNYGDAYLNRGIVKEKIGDFTGACEDFNQASVLGADKATEYFVKQCK